MSLMHQVLICGGGISGAGMFGVVSAIATVANPVAGGLLIVGAGCMAWGMITGRKGRL